LRKLLLILGLFFSVLAKGQSQDSLLTVQLSQVKTQIEASNFAGANRILINIFSSKFAIPDEVAFRYGQVQLGLNNYIKAKEAFQKYQSLTKNNGPFTKKADSLIAEANKKICQKCNNTGWAELSDSCHHCHSTGKIKVNCDECHGIGKEYCPACGGQGVVLLSGPMGTVYKSCEACKGKGIVVCTHCKGVGYKEKFCETCNGRGAFIRRVVCDHRK
jgi:hypothetical protein